MDEALYLPDGDRFVPTALTAGPWDPEAQHGGPPSALLMRAVEAVPAGGPVQIARLTVELLRPVPLVPLEVEAVVTRPGRRVQAVAASLRAGGIEVARATALQVRRADVDLPPLPDPDDPVPPVPETGLPQLFPGNAADLVAYHSAGVDLRFVGGGFDRPGPSTCWARLRQPVVAGEEPSPAVRTAAVADFGNGLSWVLPMDRWLFINPDLSIHLAREPVGEWVCLASSTLPGASGAGLAESSLFDEHGRFGRAVQSLLVEPRT